MQGIRGASSNSIIYKSSVYLTLKRDSFTKGLAERASNNSVIYKSSVYLTLKRDMLTREHPAKLPSQSWVRLLEERSASRALQAAGSAAAQAPRTWNFSAPRRPRRSEAIHVEHPSNPGALGPWPRGQGTSWKTSSEELAQAAVTRRQHSVALHGRQCVGQRLSSRCPYGS